MYLTRSFQSAPVSVKDAADSSNSLPERKCVSQLAHDVYTQDGSPNQHTPEQLATLNALNDMLFAVEKKQRRATPLDMEKVTQENNAYTLKHMRLYIEKMLDVLVPNNGKTVLN